MTTLLCGHEVAKQIADFLPDVVAVGDGTSVIIKGERLLPVAQFLQNTPGLDFDYLVSITGVDYAGYFEVVYHLTSIKHNHGLILKARCYSRENPALPSVTSVWRGADFQEREIYDLMGISFSGHPNLRRIFLWEGFPGYPLRRDYL